LPFMVAEGVAALPEAALPEAASVAASVAAATAAQRSLEAAATSAHLL
jgi:hypothetical protein